MLYTLERIKNYLWISTIDKGRWRPGWNNEIFNEYRYLNFVADFKIIRVGWAGHVVTMED